MTWGFHRPTCQARRDRSAQSGYVLVGALFLMAVMAIGMTVVAREWSFQHQRALEQELEFRGERIMRALLEYRQMQQAGQKPASKPITNYETMEKFLTEQPNPLLSALPPDPMTARYDDEGELIEDTGTWGLVVLGSPAANTPGNRRSNRPNQAGAATSGGLRIYGCPPSKRRAGERRPGEPPTSGADRGLRTGSGLPSVFDEPARPILSDRGGSGSRGAIKIGSGNIVGVVSCRDDLEPIGLSPSGEEALSYREWLFVPRELRGGGIPGAAGTVPFPRNQAQNRRTTRSGGRSGSRRSGNASGTRAANNAAAAMQQAGGAWQNNWPAAMPAPPMPVAPGTGRQDQRRGVFGGNRRNERRDRDRSVFRDR